MPIYEYRCEKCGHELEIIQKLADAPLSDCPECGEAAALRKLVSAAGFRLKGGGWYETDFKSGDKKKNLVESGKAEKADTKTDGSDGSKKAETAKTETKAESKASAKPNPA